MNEVTPPLPIQLMVPTKSIKDVAQGDPASPNHYAGAIQPWDFILSNGLGFLEGNIIKYVSRYLRKDGMKDLLKAKHYLDKLIQNHDRNSKF
jgi:uncharacterized protein DUF3310